MKKCNADECICHVCSQRCKGNLYYVGEGIWCCPRYSSLGYAQNCPNGGDLDGM